VLLDIVQVLFDDNSTDFSKTLKNCQLPCPCSSEYSATFSSTALNSTGDIPASLFLPHLSNHSITTKESASEHCNYTSSGALNVALNVSTCSTSRKDAGTSRRLKTASLLTVMIVTTLVLCLDALCTQHSYVDIVVHIPVMMNLGKCTTTFY